ncbi:MAG: ABC transporter permease DevC [Pyrinomonadaceae bacterium]|nr:ABC transporter permease DevC [Pyrinomonadaceae bacterium]
MFRKIPLAWLQLSFQKARLLTAIAGIAFAGVLMFMQFGFQEALFSTNTKIHKSFRGDFILINTQSESLFSTRPFSRRILYQTLNNPNITSASPVYIGILPWKNPWTNKERAIFIFGFEPNSDILEVKGVAENISKVNVEDAFLFDTLSRPGYGDVAANFAKGERIQTEVNKRKIEVRGLFELGSSFAADGNLITNDLNFQRLFKRELGEIDFGVLSAKEGSDLETVKAEIEKSLPKDVRILTKAGFVRFEREYIENSTAIGFIFNFGAILGLVVGIIITYQVLYTDVVNHLPEYATLKAMGYTNGFLTRVVLEESLILSLLGFVPALFVALGLYALASSGAGLPIEMTFGRAILVFFATILMCFVSGLLAMRKLKAADPADIF